MPGATIARHFVVGLVTSSKVLIRRSRSYHSMVVSLFNQLRSIRYKHATEVASTGPIASSRRI
jgi:hypothetical protein